MEEAGRCGSSLSLWRFQSFVDGSWIEPGLLVLAGLPEEEGRLGGFLQRVEGLCQRIW